MTEQELRALVREAIARHQSPSGRGVTSTPRPSDSTMAFLRQHSSHAMFTVPSGADTDGPCLIEPAVQCNHCGYCKSYGH
jgi:hypothetical protein